jgi:hypothetical protein
VCETTSANEEELPEQAKPPIETSDDKEPTDPEPTPVPIPPLFNLTRFELDLYERQYNTACDSKVRRSYIATLGPKVNIGYHRF